jgi:hypothetical protein
MTLANQDVTNAGYFCMRCHVPMSFVTGHALDYQGDTLDETDRDGVTCHFCHAMVDPVYKEGISPPEDLAILQQLESVPQHFGNSMFVLDPAGTRRGPLDDAFGAPHEWIYSPFHMTGDMCGTCHDVGNVAVSRQADGTYRYNAIDEPVPDENPHAQFPLERTYTEWKLSDFANGGVDMGGRFGGISGPVVETCQDCHMPAVYDKACLWGPERVIKRHDFAGASYWPLETIKILFADDPGVDPILMDAGIKKAKRHLRKSATLEVSRHGGDLRVRVINETGHKLPTGHIEGRRVWVNVRFLDKDGDLVREHGGYDFAEARLDEESTTVFEMHVGLSEYASGVTGLPAGPTTHMALADTIEKDNRIPPRGFANAAFEAGGAPVVGAAYADGQYWADVDFAVPPRARRAVVTLYYQTVTRHYIEALRDGNVTDNWGQILYDLWLETNRNAPFPIARAEIKVAPPTPQ